MKKSCLAKFLISIILVIILAILTLSCDLNKQSLSTIPTIPNEPIFNKIKNHLTTQQEINALLDTLEKYKNYREIEPDIAQTEELNKVLYEYSWQSIGKDLGSKEQDIEYKRVIRQLNPFVTGLHP